jgi:O-antigen ligase
MAVATRPGTAETRVRPRNGLFSRVVATGVAPTSFAVACLMAPLEYHPAPTAFTLFDALVICLAFCIVVAQERVHFPPTWLLASAYVFLLFGMLSTFRAILPFESVTQLLQFVFIFYLLLPVVFTLVRSPDVSRLSILMFTVGVLAAALPSLIGGSQTGSRRAKVFYSDNPNQLGYPSAYVLPFVLYFVLDRWRRTRSVISIVLGLMAVSLLLWAVAASGSRSSLAGLLVGLVVFLGIEFWAVWWSRIVRIGVILTLATGLGYWLYQAKLLPVLLSGRIEKTLLMREGATRDRLEAALAAWRAFLESPLLGVGLDHQNFSLISSRWVPLGSTDAHNLWLNLLAHVGLIGAAAFAILIGGWFLVLLRARRATPDASERRLMTAFLAAMSAIMTIYMFIPMMVMRQYWLVYGLGLATALALNQARRHSPDDGSRRGTRPPSRTTAGT